MSAQDIGAWPKGSLSPVLPDHSPAAGGGHLLLLLTPIPRRPQSAPRSPSSLSLLMLRAIEQRSSLKGWRLWFQAPI